MSGFKKYVQERKRFIKMSDLWTRAFAQDLQQQWLLGAYDTPLYLSIKTTCEKVRCWLEESRQFADTWARAGYEKRRALQSANMMLRDTNTPVELLPSFYERTTEAGARRY